MFLHAAEVDEPAERFQRHADSHLVECSFRVIEHHRNDMTLAAEKNIGNVTMVLNNFSQILFKCRDSITVNLEVPVSEIVVERLDLVIGYSVFAEIA